MTVATRNLLQLDFLALSVVLSALPFFSLLACFIISVLFHFKEVNETICGVDNYIPSISAVTSRGTQKYIWQYGIALHLTPRLFVAYVYTKYYRARLINAPTSSSSASSSASSFNPPSCTAARCNLSLDRLIKLNFFFNCIEVLSLGGLTIIPTKENYPIHEKLFIVYLLSFTFYMAISLHLNRLLHSQAPHRHSRQCHPRQSPENNGEAANHNGNHHPHNSHHPPADMEIRNEQHQQEHQQEQEQETHFSWDVEQATVCAAERLSYRIKRHMALLIFVTTIGLLICVYRHKVYCRPNAWSHFSLCEYIIVTAIIVFHSCFGLDFQNLEICVSGKSAARAHQHHQSHAEQSQRHGKSNGTLTKHLSPLIGCASPLENQGNTELNHRPRISAKTTRGNRHEF